MRQMSFSDFKYAGKRKHGRRRRFLAARDQTLRSTGLLGLIEPEADDVGKSWPLETLLHVYALQNWSPLSDPAIHQFACLTVGALVSEDSTIMTFRNLLDKHKCSATILAILNEVQANKTRSLSQGAIVGASIFHARRLTKREERKFASQMHQAKEGNLYLFGLIARVALKAQCAGNMLMAWNLNSGPHCISLNALPSLGADFLESYTPTESWQTAERMGVTCSLR